jgi:hypothetical protein
LRRDRPVRHFPDPVAFDENLDAFAKLGRAGIEEATTEKEMRCHEFPPVRDLATARRVLAAPKA